MKISTDALKSAYQEHARHKTRASSKDCPSPKKIIRLLRSGASDKEATKIIDHISHCSQCFSDFEFMLEVIRQEKDFIQEVQKKLPISDGPGRPKESRFKSLGLRLDWRAFVPRFSWRVALLLAGFGLATFFAAKSFIFRPPEKYRTGTAAAVQLVRPVDEKIPKAGLVFKWKKVNGSNYYVVELFDQSLAPVWKSDKITTEFAVLPKELAPILEVSRPYFWAVTAELARGEEISSRLEKFMLKE